MNIIGMVLLITIITIKIFQIYYCLLLEPTIIRLLEKRNKKNRR